MAKGSDYLTSGGGVATRFVSNTISDGTESGIFPVPVGTDPAININNIDIWVDGIKLVRDGGSGGEYTSDGTNVTITSPPIVNLTDIDIITWE